MHNEILEYKIKNLATNNKNYVKEVSHIKIELKKLNKELVNYNNKKTVGNINKIINKID